MKHDPKRLLLEITRCPIAQSYSENNSPPGPCSDIVATQRAASWANFQVPEPWSGNLATAPILFLSSNPSISETEAYPRGDSTDQLLQDFFDRRFHGIWSRHGLKVRNLDGTYGPVVRYWSCIRNRASEILGKPAEPGTDDVLSEVVHCKSIMGRGVQNALHVCAERYSRVRGRGYSDGTKALNPA